MKHRIRNNAPSIRRIRSRITAFRTTVVILLLMAVVFGVTAQVGELQLKALFLEAAVRFISWPSGLTTAIPAGPPESLTIGVFKGDRLTPHITTAFRKNRTRGQTIRIRPIRHLQDIDSCAILVIPESRAASLRHYIDYCKNRPVLTVGDTPAFAARGVILTITIVHQRVSCTINKPAADAAGFVISHHLLQKATVLTSGELP